MQEWYKQINSSFIEHISNTFAHSIRIEWELLRTEQRQATELFCLLNHNVWLFSDTIQKSPEWFIRIEIDLYGFLLDIRISKNHKEIELTWNEKQKSLVNINLLFRNHQNLIQNKINKKMAFSARITMKL